MNDSFFLGQVLAFFGSTEILGISSLGIYYQKIKVFAEEVENESESPFSPC